jgi:hypothetical protein
MKPINSECAFWTFVLVSGLCVGSLLATSDEDNSKKTDESNFPRHLIFGFGSQGISLFRNEEDLREYAKESTYRARAARVTK